MNLVEKCIVLCIDASNPTIGVVFMHERRIFSYEFSVHFIASLFKTQTYYDSIFAIVDRLTKIVHFIPTLTTMVVISIAELCMKNICRIHMDSRKILLVTKILFLLNKF